MPHTMTLAAGCVMTLACVSCARSYMDACRVSSYLRAFFLKGGAALCFLALGLLGATRCSLPSFAWKIVGGLFFGLVGDELLAMRNVQKERFDLYFSSGALSFALGHCLYIWALLSRGAALAPALCIAAALSAASFVYLRRMDFKPGKLALGAVPYMFIVVFMGSVALSSAIAGRSIGALLFALGGLLFILSDNALCVHTFGRDRRFVLDQFVHATYYAAQLLIAWSLFLI